MRGVAPLLIIGLAAGALVLAAGGYWSYDTISGLQSSVASTTAANQSLSEELAEARSENMELTEKLAAELRRNGDFETQIGSLASTVGTLTKLSQTDKELLQKYSKIYFLNENYIPSSLSEIDSEWELQPERTYQIHTKVQPYLERMLEAAKDDGAPMLVLSAYRSYGEQIDLKIRYTTTYGAGANRFSADQGYSEHQLGTALDLTTKELSTTSLGFATSKAGQWMDDNAYKYGFILSYPKSNTFYQYEPWHWRFVGVKLATYLHDENKRFYDLDQRTIDTYLVDIFD